MADQKREGVFIALLDSLFAGKPVVGKIEKQRRRELDLETAKRRNAKARAVQKAAAEDRARIFAENAERGHPDLPMIPYKQAEYDEKTGKVRFVTKYRPAVEKLEGMERERKLQNKPL